MEHWAANYRNDDDSLQQPFQNRMVLEPAVIESSIATLMREQKPKSIGSIPPHKVIKQECGLSTPTHKRCASDPTPVRFPEGEIEIDEDTQSVEDSHSSRGSPWLDIPEASTWGALSSLWKLGNQITRERTKFPKLVRIIY